MSVDAPRRIWLCADDYGISPGVNRGIRDLIASGRINAASVMTVGPAVGGDEIRALATVVAEARHCAVGLHVTLTAPFCPLTMHVRPLQDGLFLPLGKLLRASLLRQLDTEIIRAEIIAQIAAFAALFGRTPDYLDGHQHVHIFPQIRDAFLSAAKANAPNAWVRQCGRDQPFARRWKTPKALLLDVLSATFRRRAAQAGIAFNPDFAGAYDFTRPADFGELMRGFLDGLPAGGLVMCHPGFVDQTLIALDPFTDQRAREYAYLAGGEFPRLLAANGITLG